MEKRVDNNNDGVVDVKYTNTLDANGHVIEQTTDVNNNGSIESIVRNELDSRGNVIASYIDSSGDGTVDRVESYTLDANGNKVSKSVYIGDSIKDNYDAFETYTLDNNGRITETLSDSNGDGVYDVKTNTTYDVYGNAIKIETDNGNDGSIDVISNRVYGSNNELIKQDVLDGTGNIQNTISYTYNSQGLIDSSTQPAGITHFKYDDQNRYSYVGRDTDLDGKDNWWNYNYIYDNQNRIATFINHGSTGIESKITYVYDDLNHLILDIRDTQNDGVVDRIIFGAQAIYQGTNTVDHTEDFTDTTKWNNSEKTSNMSLSGLWLSDSAAKSTVILDKSFISKAFAESTDIYGDSTDVVILKDFTESDKLSGTINKNGQVLNQYQFTDSDGNTHTLLIDTDINVTFG